MTNWGAANPEAASSFNQFSETPQMRVWQFISSLQEKADKVLRMFSPKSDHADDR